MTALENAKSFVTSKAARQLLLAQKHSPKMLFVAGTVGVIGATVLACRATLKLDEVVHEYETRQSTITEDDSLVEGQEAKMLGGAKVILAAQIAKLYAPAIGVGIVSIAALTGSHVVLTKRNGALMAAYAGVDRAFKEYRQRVSDEYGTAVDHKFVTGTEEVLVEEKLADGKTKTTLKTVQSNKLGESPYVFMFDENSRFFSTEPGMNAQIIQMKQLWANDKLRNQGHLFLNEVLEMLGLPKTKAGQIVGWVYRKDNDRPNGDNYVDFGVFDGDPEWVEEFINGHEKYVKLNFNCDGAVLDLI